MKNFSKTQIIELVLLAVAVIFWLLRRANILYVPGLSSILLGIVLVMVGMGLIANKQDKVKKYVGIAVLAFGLLNVIVAFFEFTGRLA